MRRILFVDDDEDIRTIARLSLSRGGATAVTVAASGAEAIACASQVQPDVIVMDVMMPDLDGPATLQKLREDPALADVPVIFMTAKVQKSDVERYQALGAGVIAKPFDPMRLPDEVDRILSAAGAARPVTP